MDAIGGYFELADRETGVFPHLGGALLNTGRNALEYILRSLPNVKGVWVPYFTCKVVLEPIIKLNISYFFYHINTQFEIAENINLQDGQYLIVNNYFGIKDAYINELFEEYSDRLIVDCAQALLYKPQPGMKAFYSCRKYVGTADGGVAYGVSEETVQMYEKDCIDDHSNHLILRKSFGPEFGFEAFQQNELKLNGRPLRRMSDKTLDILNHINYVMIMDKRRANFQLLDLALGSINLLELPSINSYACPMIYPFASRDDNLRDKLIKNKVYVARYWPNVLKWCMPSDVECDMATHIIPLPIDQRYGMVEMERIISEVL